jgi:hypothetical protein
MQITPGTFFSYLRIAAQRIAWATGDTDRASHFVLAVDQNAMCKE